MKTTKAIIRKFKDGGGIIALFPNESAALQDDSIMSYQYIGQHGAADMGICESITEPASIDEIRNMIDHLENIIGYDCIESVTELTSFTGMKG